MNADHSHHSQTHHSSKKQSSPTGMETMSTKRASTNVRLRKRSSPDDVIQLGNYLFHPSADEDDSHGTTFDKEMVVGEEYEVPIAMNHIRIKRQCRQASSSSLKTVASVPALTELAEQDEPLKTPTKQPSAFLASSASAPSLQALLVQEPLQFENAEHPDTVLESILSDHGITMTTVPSLSVQNFFVEMTEKNIAGYESELISAIRANDLDTLREGYLYKGKTLQCCNRFGESILHMACRRGATEVVRFLVEEADIDVKVRDDYGRTPLHDACWTRDPELELVTILLRQCPDLLYMTDKRGFTPLSYARKNHWSIWCKYLELESSLLIPRSGVTGM